MKVQEKEVVVLCSRPPQNVKLGSNGKELSKKSVMHAQSFCFANSNLFSAYFWLSRYSRRLRCLTELPIIAVGDWGAAFSSVISRILINTVPLTFFIIILGISLFWFWEKHTPALLNWHFEFFISPNKQTSSLTFVRIFQTFCALFAALLT